MKFIRFGDIKAFEQKCYKRCPRVDEFVHAPPRRRGFFAFPYAFFDPSYIIQHPVSEPHSPLKYLRDKNGRILTHRDLWEAPSEKEILKSLGLPKQPIMLDWRPSWVCIMRDPKNPPIRTSKGRLNQKFGYLKDVHGKRVDARCFFRFDWDRWHLHDFDGEGSFCHCKLSEIDDNALCLMGVYECYDDLGTHSERETQKMTADYLLKHGVSVESLFPWPLYEKGEDAFIAVYKKPRIFDYDGCIWHHLRKFVPRGSVLAAYGTTWVYTAMRDFASALKHVKPKVYAKNRASRGNVRANRFGGPKCDSGFSPEDIYEVFFDEEEVRRIS